jgi:histidinol-phosphate aminotransferase
LTTSIEPHEVDRPAIRVKNRLPRESIFSATPRSDGILLNSNEPRLPLPEAFVKRVRRELSSVDLRHYPDPAESEKLKEALAAHLGVDAENLLLGVGSTEALDLVARAYGEAGSKIVVPAPTFPLYGQYADMNDKDFVKAPLDADFALSSAVADAMLAIEGPKLYYVGNPNNPTGLCVEKEAFDLLAADTSSLLCLDEAYADYSSTSYIQDAVARDNVVVTRSFSKIGLAACRFGYLAASRSVIRDISRACLPFRVNSITLRIARIFLEEFSLFRPLIDMTKRERSRLFDELAAMKGFAPIPSAGNFIFCAVPGNATSVADRLQNEHRIFVKAFPPTLRMKSYLRITVGSSEENDTLLRALASICLELDSSALQ